MSTAIVVLACAMLVFAFFQWLIGIAFYLRFTNLKPAAEQPWPNATVVLSLRGFDEVLVECLAGLLNLDYPNYSVSIVIDSEQDTAWPEVQRIIQENRATHVRVETLKTRLKTCSLKCSSLIQAVENLDSRCEVVAFLDADVVPHRTWLRELVAPLADPKIGATTGNRWYHGGGTSLASLMRSIWNAGAAGLMVLFKIAWGGSLAARRETIERLKVTDKWRLSFNDDVLLGETVRRGGLKLAFIPSLIMMNREDCTVRGMLSFTARQMMHARFYHGNWWAILAFGLPCVLSAPLGLVLLPVVLPFVSWQTSAILAGALIGYTALIRASYWMAELAVDKVARLRGEPLAFCGFRWYLAIMPALIASGLAMMDAAVRRNVLWRGIRYRIRGPFRVEMVHYAPFTGARGVMEIDELPDTANRAGEKTPAP